MWPRVDASVIEPALEGALDGQHDRIRFERFRDEVVRPGRQTFDDVFRPVFGREQNDIGVAGGRPLADLDRAFCTLLASADSVFLA